MKSVVKYETDDGQFFDSKNAAHNHEMGLAFKMSVKALFPDPFASNRADHLLEAALEKPTELRDLLSSLIKKTRKVESEGEGETESTEAESEE